MDHSLDPRFLYDFYINALISYIGGIGLEGGLLILSAFIVFQCCMTVNLYILQSNLYINEINEICSHIFSLGTIFSNL